MKKILLILLLFTASLTAQVGTENITLDEVLDEIYGNVDHSGKSIQDCITYANTNGVWDAIYSGSKNSLLNFRGYQKETTTLVGAWLQAFYTSVYDAAHSGGTLHSTTLYAYKIDGTSSYKLNVGDFIYSNTSLLPYIPSVGLVYSKLTADTNFPVTVYQISTTSGEIIASFEVAN